MAALRCRSVRAGLRLHPSRRDQGVFRRADAHACVAVRHAARWRRVPVAAGGRRNRPGARACRVSRGGWSAVARATVKTLAQQRDKIELLQRLKTLRPDAVRRWGRMNARQMVCHLTDAFRMALGEKPVSSTSGAAAIAQRTFIRWMALYLPARWPAGILTRPEIDQEIGGTKPGDFAADVAELEALLESMTDLSRRDWPP